MLNTFRVAGQIIIAPAMPKKHKRAKNTDSEDGLWIAPRYSLKGANGDRAWENRPGGPPHSSRFLELADIALGLKKTASKKGKRAATGIHATTVKTEPYSN